MLGKNLLPTKINISTAASSLESPASAGTSSGTSALGSAAGAAISAGASALGAAASSEISSLSSSLSNLTSALESELGVLISGVVTDISKALGIEQWYSFHVMDMCEGVYLAPAQAGGSSGFNTSSCSGASGLSLFTPFPSSYPSPLPIKPKLITWCATKGDFGLSSITSTLNKQLSTGPLSTTLSALQVPTTLESGLDAISTIAKVPFVLYILGIIFAGLVIPLSALSFLMEPTRLVTLVHISFSNLAFVSFFTSSIVITIVQSQATSLINTLGGPVGLKADGGSRYFALTWSATVIMGLGAIVGVTECCLARRKVKNMRDGLLDEKGVLVRPGWLERVRGTDGKSIADRVLDRARRWGGGMKERRLSDTSDLTPL
jgi:SUR7/PalI family